MVNFLSSLQAITEAKRRQQKRRNEWSQSMKEPFFDTFFLSWLSFTDFSFANGLGLMGSKSVHVELRFLSSAQEARKSLNQEVKEDMSQLSQAGVATFRVFPSEQLQVWVLFCWSCHIPYIPSIKAACWSSLKFTTPIRKEMETAWNAVHRFYDLQKELVREENEKWRAKLEATRHASANARKEDAIET